MQKNEKEALFEKFKSYFLLRNFCLNFLWNIILLVLIILLLDKKYLNSETILAGSIFATIVACGRTAISFINQIVEDKETCLGLFEIWCKKRKS